MVAIDVSTVLTSFRLFFGQNYCSFAAKKKEENNLILYVGYPIVLCSLLNDVRNHKQILLWFFFLVLHTLFSLSFGQLTAIRHQIRVIALCYWTRWHNIHSYESGKFFTFICVQILTNIRKDPFSRMFRIYFEMLSIFWEYLNTVDSTVFFYLNRINIFF